MITVAILFSCKLNFFSHAHIWPMYMQAASDINEMLYIGTLIFNNLTTVLSTVEI
jgi:hypothetical protein